MPPEPPLPAVVLARAVVADVAAQAAEPVAVVPVDLVRLRSPQFLVPARLRLAEVAPLAAVDVAVVDVAVVAASVVAVVLPLHQLIAALKCRAWRSSTCCWLPV